MSFILYHLARNPEKQNKLYEEICRVLPDYKGVITWQILSQFSYLKAVVKETFRLNPISIGVGRTLQTDSTISGFNVPKNVIII